MRGNTNSITELSVKTGTSDKLTNVTIYMELLEKRGGVVSWNGELSSTVDIASWQTLATLPQGFRPNSNFMTSLVDFGGNNLPLTVTTEGQIKTSHVLKNKNDGHYYYLSMVFMAGGGIKALLGKARALLQGVLSHAGKYQRTGSAEEHRRDGRQRYAEDYWHSPIPRYVVVDKHIGQGRSEDRPALTDTIPGRECKDRDRCEEGCIEQRILGSADANRWYGLYHSGEDRQWSILKQNHRCVLIPGAVA